MKFGVKQLYAISFKDNLEIRIWKKLKQCWYYHNAYCYDNTSARFYCYGKIGWKVCDEWNCFNPCGLMNFYLWAKNYIKTEEDLSLYLGKDLLDGGLKTIRPESCRWITNAENTREKNSRHIEEQRELMRKIGKANKGKHFKINKAESERRKQCMLEINKHKDYKAEAIKISQTLRNKKQVKTKGYV